MELKEIYRVLDEAEFQFNLCRKIAVSNPDMFYAYADYSVTRLSALGMRVNYNCVEEALRETAVIKGILARGFWDTGYNLNDLVRELASVRVKGIAKRLIFPEEGPDEVEALEKVFRKYGVELYQDIGSVCSAAESLVRQSSEREIMRCFPQRKLLERFMSIGPFFNSYGYAKMHILRGVHYET